MYVHTYVRTHTLAAQAQTYMHTQNQSNTMYVCTYVATLLLVTIIGVQMCLHCLQAVGVASGHQNSLQHQNTGGYLYALPNKNNKVQKVRMYVISCM